MTTHSSASLREQAANNTNASIGNKASQDSVVSNRELDPSIKRRARLLATKGSVPHQTRALIRYGLQMKDPYLAQIVRRVEAGEIEIHRLHMD
jgi:hypothetical protein